MKKKICIITTVLFLLGSIPITIFASNHWALTSNTFVKNIHEGYWSDEYTGIVSVYGSDIIMQNTSFYYPTYSRISYNVQGDITVEQVDSYGQNDDVQRMKEITVYDQWNTGTSTKCSYNFGLALRSSN